MIHMWHDWSKSHSILHLSTTWQVTSQTPQESYRILTPFDIVSKSSWVLIGTFLPKHKNRIQVRHIIQSFPCRYAIFNEFHWGGWCQAPIRPAYAHGAPSIVLLRRDGADLAFWGPDDGILGRSASDARKRLGTQEFHCGTLKTWLNYSNS